MNRVCEYVKSLSDAEKEKLIDILTANAPDEVPGMKDIRESFDSDKEDGLSRSHSVYINKKRYPKINLSKLCYDFGVSETTFKKYKSIHGTEWEASYNTNGKFCLLEFAFEEAQEEDKTEWKMYYNTAPRDIFLIPKSFSPGKQPPPLLPSQLITFPEQKPISIVNERGLMK